MDNVVVSNMHNNTLCSFFLLFLFFIVSFIYFQYLVSVTARKYFLLVDTNSFYKMGSLICGLKLSQWENCLSLDFYFHGLSEPRNP